MIEGLNVVDGLDAALRPLGFRRRRNTWNRTVEAFVDVIDVQRSKSRTHIWVNLGVADPETYKRTWDAELPAFVDEGLCTVRERLGILLTGLDRYWDLDEPSAPINIRTAIVETGLPFLDRMHGREALVDFLVDRPRLPPDVLYLSSLLAAYGRQDEACAVLAKYVSTSRGNWSARARKMAAEINCGS